MGDEVETAEIEAEAGEVVPETDKAPEAEKKEGTPDKALQKLQQDQAATLRLLERLNEKKDAGEALTPKEQRKLDKVRDLLKTEYSLVDDDAGRAVTEALVEQADDTESLKSQLALALKRLETIEGTVSWTEVQKKYPDLDTDAIWKKAWDDTGELLGSDAAPDSMRRVASKFFNERCEAAKKRAGGGKDEKKGKDETTYKVGSGQRPAPILSDADSLLAEARGLVIEI